MAVVSSLFFVVAFILAVALGPQTRPWPWGPALIALALAVLAALPGWWKTKRLSDPWFLFFGLLTTGWIAARAWVSPVHELAIADLLLLAGAVGSFLVMRGIAESGAAIRIFTWGLALLLLANVVVIGIQVANPAFNLIFWSRPQPFPSGLYAHYNEVANFLIGSSLVLVGAAAFGKENVISRLIWGLISLSGMAAVYFTHSRGAILAMALGAVVFWILSIIISKQRKSALFLPLLFGLPAFILIAGGVVSYGWISAQQARGTDPNSLMDALMDNSIRLYLMGIALSCIQLHPWVGGGSRSFSWECYQFWGYQDNGFTASRPEQVHNEFLQSMTDYGIVAGLLLLGLFVTLMIGLLLRVMNSHSSRRHSQSEAMWVGGLAALIGMLVQSSFSFVFHLMPGAILLGICLGRASLPLELTASPRWKMLPLKLGLTVTSLFAVALMAPYAIKGTKVMSVLWPTYFGNPQQVTEQDRLDDLRRALAIWPQASLYKDRALLLHRAVEESFARKAPTNELTAAAIADYQAANRFHSHDPTVATNLANMLSLSHQDDEARVAYKQAIDLQGGLELGFRAHFNFATHLLKKGFSQLNDRNSEMALASFQEASAEIDQSLRESPLFGSWIVPLQATIYDGIGQAQEQLGDFDAALNTYLQPGIPSGRFRAAKLLTKMAVTASSERRPSEALTRFQQARSHLIASTELPPDVKPEERTELIAYLDQSIQFLLGAKIEPLPTQ